MDRAVFSGVERGLQAHVDTLHRRPWSQVEVTVGPLARAAMERGHEGARFAKKMVDVAGLLDTFATDAARVAATGGEPRAVSENLHKELEGLKQYVKDYGWKDQHAMAAAVSAIENVQGLMDWDYLEENAL